MNCVWCRVSGAIPLLLVLFTSTWWYIWQHIYHKRINLILTIMFCIKFCVYGDCLTAIVSKPTFYTTLDNGYLGSRNDEERSEVR